MKKLSQLLKPKNATTEIITGNVSFGLVLAEMITPDEYLTFE
jgi:hypothetical protein